MTWRDTLWMLVGTSLLLPTIASAEKADSDKPMDVRALTMSSDQTRRISIFEGNATIVKGTLIIRADRIVIYQDEDGYTVATATGKPARYRQKREGVDEYLEGEALTIVQDERRDRLELRDQALFKRSQDQIQGDAIEVDTRAEFYTVKSAKSGGRGRAVIQPRKDTE